MADSNQDSIKVFFTPSNSNFLFSSVAWGLTFGDSVVENMQKSLMEESANLDLQLKANFNYLMAVDFRSDLDKDFICQAHCQYIDLLLKRGKPEDLEEAEKNLNNLILARCRKDSFETVCLS